METGIAGGDMLKSAKGLADGIAQYLSVRSASVEAW